MLPFNKIKSLREEHLEYVKVEVFFLTTEIEMMPESHM